MADGKAPEDKLLTRGEWEVIQQRSAEKGQKAREAAQREHEERKAKMDQQEQAMIEKHIAKRATVVRNLDATEGGGLGASSHRYAISHPTPPSRMFP